MQAVIGSRTIKEFNFDGLGLKSVISGGAVGIDQAVEKYCKDRGIPITIITPDYSKGPKAPLIRNKEIIDRATEVFAIWNGISTGTTHALAYARTKKIPITLFIWDAFKGSYQVSTENWNPDHDVRSYNDKTVTNAE